MASPLIWQQVQAPNFSSALDGYRISAGMFRDAIGGLGDAFASFQQRQSDAADKQVLANIMTKGTGADLQRALSDGSFLGGANLGNVSADTLKAIGARQGQLLDQDASRQRMSILGEQADRDRAAFGASGAVQALMDAAYRGDEKTFRTLSQENADVLSGLGAKGVTDLFQAAQGFTDSRLGNENTRSMINTRAADLGLRRSAQAAQQAALGQTNAVNTLAAEVLQRSGGDPTIMRDLMDGMGGKVPANVYMGVMGTLDKIAGGSGSGGRGKVGTNAVAGAGARPDGLDSSYNYNSAVGAAGDTLALANQTASSGAWNPKLLMERASMSRTPAEVVKDLSENSMKGVSDGDITSSLNTVMRELNVTPDVAALALENSMDSTLMGNRKLSKSALNEAIKSYQNNAPEYALYASREMNELNKRITKQNEKVLDKSIRLEELTRRSSNNPKLKGAMDMLSKEISKDKDRLEDLIDQSSKYIKDSQKGSSATRLLNEATAEEPVNFKNLRPSDTELLKRYLRN